MKLKQVALTLLAALTASASLYAQNEKVYITKGMAETEEWEDEYGSAITYNYNINNKDIVLDKSIAYGSYNDAYFYWDGENGGTYTVSGKGKLTGYGQYWNLGKGTYVIDKGTSLGNWAGVYGNGCDLVVNSDCKIWELGGIDTLYVNAPKFQVTDYIYDIDTIISTCDIQTKNFNGLIGNGVSTVEGNVVVNGGMWHGTYYTLDVFGNINFASKTNIDVFSYDYGDGYGKPTSEEITNLLMSDADGMVIMTCDTYTGNVSNLNLRVGYYQGEYYDEKYLNVSSYGTFVAMYDMGGSYNITYKLYDTASSLPEAIYDETIDASYYELYDEDIYLKGNTNLSKTGEAFIDWNASGYSVCLFGKGAISAKNGLTVEFTDGYYTIDKNVSFKKASYGLYESIVSFGNAVAAKDIQLGYSTLNISTGKLTVDNELAIRDYSTVQLTDALTTGDLIVDGKSDLEVTSSKASSITVKGLAYLHDESYVKVSGKLTATDIEMNHSVIMPTAKDSPMSLTVKSSIFAENDSSIILNGKLSAGSMDSRDSLIYS